MNFTVYLCCYVAINVCNDTLGSMIAPWHPNWVVCHKVKFILFGGVVCHAQKYDNEFGVPCAKDYS